jgi:hypothetical protein
MVVKKTKNTIKIKIREIEKKFTEKSKEPIR